jgi:acetate kinase
VWADGRKTEHRLGLGGDWLGALDCALPDLARVEKIGILLEQGGDLFRRTLEPVDPHTITRVQEVAHLAPECGYTTLALLRHWAATEPCPDQVILCDSAFFTDLPDEVRDYALPLEITGRGFRRWGGHGLCHEQSWKRAEDLSGGRAERVVSMFVGDSCDAAAVRAGVACETSIGLTHLEGIMSAHGCGDIDPTITFQLGASGMPYSEINRVLSVESGFKALVGRPCGLAELLSAESDPATALARRMLFHQLRKYVGAFVSALGGVDTLVFTGEHTATTHRVAREVCENLDFAGLRCNWESEPGRLPRAVSTDDSTVRVILGRYGLWDAMAKRISP